MNKTQLQVATFAAAFTVAAYANDALALDGPIQVGITPIQKSLAGGGVANSEDAGAIAINPAGLMDTGQQFNAAIGGIMPYPGSQASKTGLIAPTSVTSDQNFFPLPSFFYSQPIDGVSSFGVGLYGNGGLGTSFVVPHNNNTGTAGIFGTGVAGVNVLQAFLSAAYAHRFGNVSIGVAPIFSVQRFNAWGASAFAGLSTNPDALSNRSYDWSVGVGLRAGAQWNVVPGLRLAIAGQTPVVYSNIPLYRGLLPNQGSGFNAPANLTAGIAWDALPSVTLMFDYKHIFFSQVAGYGNSSAVFPPLLGATGGPGFGWRDMNVFTVSGEWRINPNWTVRAGYARNNQIIRPQDIVFNMLAPVVSTDQISAGVTYRVTENSYIDAAAAFIPRQNLTASVSPAFGGGTVTLTNWVVEVSIGWTYKFNTGPAPLMAKY